MHALSVIAQNLSVSSQDVSNTIKSMIVSAKNQNGATCSDAELMVVASTCAKYGLNPLMKEIHAFISKGKLSVVIGVDGWIKILVRHKDYNGHRQIEKFDENGKLICVTTEIHVKGRDYPTCVNKYMCESYQDKSEAWKNYPIHMLSMKSLALGVRVAFGISEVMDDDEVRRYPEEKQVNNQPNKKTVSERLSEYRDAFALCSTYDEMKALGMSIKRELDISGEFDLFRDGLTNIREDWENRFTSNTVDAQFEEVVNTETGEAVHADEIYDIEF